MFRQKGTLSNYLTTEKEVKLGRGKESISEFMKFSTISLNSQENSNGIGITIPILQKKKLSAQRGDVNSLKVSQGASYEARTWGLDTFLNFPGSWGVRLEGVGGDSQASDKPALVKLPIKGKQHFLG